ncbi:MAG TPA: TerC family protein [Bryobacteraceae bacterium]|jgi:YjbE family integral membrane protein|nr:TerC family protein [Bryobacteraceae bacterium]
MQLPHGTLPLLVDYFSIILIDILLAGDNALVIAMTVRVLSKQQRRIAITFGAAAAVVLRVIITIAAARLLSIEFLKLLGGAFVLWIAVKVFTDASSPPPEAPSRGKFLQVIWLIVVADITMSIDNVLAIAGAAKGNTSLILFGLGVSIPFVVFSSNLIAILMDRYPVIVYLGAAILGKVGGEMMATDPFITRTLHPSAALIYVVEGLAIVGILVAGRLLSKGRNHPPAADHDQLVR